MGGSFRYARAGAPPCPELGPHSPRGNGGAPSHVMQPAFNGMATLMANPLLRLESLLLTLGVALAFVSSAHGLERRPVLALPVVQQPAAVPCASPCPARVDQPGSGISAMSNAGPGSSSSGGSSSGGGSSSSGGVSSSGGSSGGSSSGGSSSSGSGSGGLGGIGSGVGGAVGGLGGSSTGGLGGTLDGATDNAGSGGDLDSGNNGKSKSKSKS